jgi:hypothetical protein
MAWALWGHIPMPGLEEFKSKKFAIADVGESVTSGRKATRKRQAEEESTQRRNQAGRGISTADTIAMKDLEQRKDSYLAYKCSIDQNDYELELQTYQTELEFCNTEIYQWSSMVTNKPEIFANGRESHQHFYESYFPYQQWYDATQRRKQVMENIIQLRTRMAEEKAEANKELQEEKKKRSKKQDDDEEEEEEEINSTPVPSQIQVVDQQSADDQLPKPTEEDEMM